MTSPTSLYFVRHGDVYNPQAVYYGRLPGFGLSEEGHRQAQAAADALRDKPLAAVFSSPLLRARETAESILKSHSSLTLRISQLLNEVYTPFDGCKYSEVAARNGDVYTGVGPQYEQPLDVLARSQQFVTIVRRRYVGQHVVAVTHGDVIALMTLWVKGVPMSRKHGKALSGRSLLDNYPAPASITKFVYQTRARDEVPILEYIEPY